MDIDAGIVFETTNLGPWRQVPVRDHVARVFQKPTAFQNDANAAAYGEFWAGAGRSARSMVLFTLGTGVGGGIVIGDQILHGQHSHGGELGHVKIDMTNPRRCGCGRFGCLEAYASAVAVVKRAQEALAAGGPSRLAERAESLTARDVFQAAEQGDELAGRIVEETAFYLAVGAMNLMHVIDPDLVVFGGGMIAAGEAFLERIRYHVRTLAFPVPAEKTEVRYAQLGADAGFIGAAGCARLLVARHGQSIGS
jgi:glucokinase